MKTITIGRETPALTYELFKALAEKNEREAQRKAKIERLKATLSFWRKEEA
jgi:molybdopterin synthase catalytic subunit